VSTQRNGVDAFQLLTFPIADVPLKLPAMPSGKSGPTAAARIAQGRVQLKGKVGGKDYGQLQISCIVPAGFTQASFRQALVDSAASLRWTSISAKLALTKAVTRATLDSRKALEGPEVQFELMGTCSDFAGPSQAGR